MFEGAYPYLERFKANNIIMEYSPGQSAGNWLLGWLGCKGSDGCSAGCWIGWLVGWLGCEGSVGCSAGCWIGWLVGWGVKARLVAQPAVGLVGCLVGV